MDGNAPRQSGAATTQAVERRMSDRTRAVRRSRWAWRPAARSGATAIAAAALAVAAAACSSGGSPHAGRTSSSASTVAYSACIRSHRVPNFPDPASGGQIPKGDAQQLGVSNSQLHTAEQACAHLIPPTGETAEQQQETQCAMAGDCSQAVVQQWMTGLRTLAQCLRLHGEPNWPDPIITSLAGHPPAPHFPYEQSGIDHHSPQVLTKVDECTRLSGFAGLPLP